MAAEKIILCKKIECGDTIPRYFSGKNVFITGASGFMGKVLLEKLLRSCPDIGKIYILLRLKKTSSLEIRLKEITDNVLFNTLKQSNPDILKKIVPIEGNVKEINLAISEQDRAEIIENVSIVYHVAATVRFDETLAESVLINTRGTREVCNLVLALKKVDAFLHVSTAYCQHDKKVVEEKLYPAPANWRDIIKVIEDTDQYAMKIISPKLASGYPNYYTYTKALAEGVIQDLCEFKVPTILIRPTIVTAINGDPIPGWVDNMNGPVGLAVAMGKGILRSSYLYDDSIFDFIPVDCAADAFIKATWLQRYLPMDEIVVYNCSSYGKLSVTMKSIVEMGWKVLKNAPPRSLFYPCINVTNNKLLHLCNIYLYQFLPAVFIDLYLKFINETPRLLKIQRRIYLALSSLEYFMMHSWIFRNEKFYELDDFVDVSDVDKFVTHLEDIDITKAFLTNCKVGVQLLLEEEDLDFEANKIRLQRMKFIHYFVKYSFYSLVLLGLYYYVIIPCMVRYINYLYDL